ncbi:MAG: 50S ribosomal protein L11 methyltransferase [Pseudorhodoplanes sp.]
MSGAPEPSIVARLTTTEREARALTMLLGESFDAEESAIAAFEETPGQWRVAIHFRDPPNEAAIRAVVGLAAGPEAANALVFESIAAQDWVAQSLSGLTPVAAGRFIVHGRHDRAQVPANKTGIEIEAGLAFGTGHHGTTRGCLLALDAWLKRNARKSPRILDIGTGTGVLAIAAARALRRPVLASDIDAMSVRVARENARLNRAAVVAIHAAGLRSRQFRKRGFDLVFANILAEPLKRMAADAAARVAPDGCMVLSGLLVPHAPGVIAAYRAQGLALERRMRLEEWVTLVMRREG